MFGALIIEEAGATFHDIRKGKELSFGTKAVIKRRDGTSFREFVLFVHDFALLFDGCGKALNPPEVPGSHDDPGVMGINYRCEPMRERLCRHDDPDGLLFVPMEEADAALSGKYRHKPLIIRANAGDWIEITLHNLLDKNCPVRYFDYPTVLLDKEHKPSMRVSLNPQFLRYDPVRDSGINVGYNHMEQTVAPGESKRYLWKADREYGACIIQSFGDMRNHRYHGLFGAVIVEPPGAMWYQNLSMRKGTYAQQAVITAPGVETFREYVLFIQNGIRLLDKDGNLIKTAIGEEGEDVDAEDT